MYALFTKQNRREGEEKKRGIRSGQIARGRNQGTGGREGRTEGREKRKTVKRDWQGKEWEEEQKKGKNRNWKRKILDTNKRKN